MSKNRRDSSADATQPPASQPDQTGFGDPGVRHRLLAALAKKLAPFGAAGVEDGSRVSHIREVLDHGRPFAEPVRLVSGDPRHCQVNAALIWSDDPEEYRLVTGYALARETLVAEPGPRVVPMWVAHSWVLWDKTLIETTFEHAAYFGVVLSPTAAYRFFSAHVMAPQFRRGNVPAEFLAEYAHLYPLATQAMAELMGDSDPDETRESRGTPVRSAGARPGLSLDEEAGARAADGEERPLGARQARKWAKQKKARMEAKEREARRSQEGRSAPPG